jgi:hypothetical protein
VLVVAGLSLKNLQPRVWDRASEFYLPGLKAVMVSYAEFHQMPARRTAAMRVGLRKYLGVPTHVSVYLDNGAFYFGTQDQGEAPIEDYVEFVEAAMPCWKPIPQDYIPFPSMSPVKRQVCFDKTMRLNDLYNSNTFVPVVHIGSHLLKYTERVVACPKLSKKPCIALGAIVPNLLRKPKAIHYSKVLSGLQHVRDAFKDKELHVFGVGGTATLHVMSLLNIDSADSSGWRNRAARGIIQLQGSGERLVASLGKWRGRHPTWKEWQRLHKCGCPACAKYGTDGLKANKLHGFSCRATHNLWVLLEENKWLEVHALGGSYVEHYADRVDNSVYRPIIDSLLNLLGHQDLPPIKRRRRKRKKSH